MASKRTKGTTAALLLSLWLSEHHANPTEGGFVQGFSLPALNRPRNKRLRSQVTGYSDKRHLLTVLQAGSRDSTPFFAQTQGNPARPVNGDSAVNGDASGKADDTSNADFLLSSINDQTLSGNFAEAEEAWMQYIALYPFVSSYTAFAKWAEYEAGSVHLARSIFERMLTELNPLDVKQPWVFKEWAAFEERQGEFERSRIICNQLEDMVDDTRKQRLPLRGDRPDKRRPPNGSKVNVPASGNLESFGPTNGEVFVKSKVPRPPRDAPMRDLLGKMDDETKENKGRDKSIGGFFGFGHKTKETKGNGFSGQLGIAAVLSAVSVGVLLDVFPEIPTGSFPPFLTPIESSLARVAEGVQARVNNAASDEERRLLAASLQQEAKMKLAQIKEKLPADLIPKPAETSSAFALEKVLAESTQPSTDPSLMSLMRPYTPSGEEIDRFMDEVNDRREKEAAAKPAAPEVKPSSALDAVKEKTATIAEVVKEKAMTPGLVVDRDSVAEVQSEALAKLDLKLAKLYNDMGSASKEERDEFAVQLAREALDLANEAMEAAKGAPMPQLLEPQSVENKKSDDPTASIEVADTAATKQQQQQQLEPPAPEPPSIKAAEEAPKQLPSELPAPKPTENRELGVAPASSSKSDTSTPALSESKVRAGDDVKMESEVAPKPAIDQPVISSTGKEIETKDLPIKNEKDSPINAEPGTQLPEVAANKQDQRPVADSSALSENAQPKSKDEVASVLATNDPVIREEPTTNELLQPNDKLLAFPETKKATMDTNEGKPTATASVAESKAEERAATPPMTDAGRLLSQGAPVPIGETSSADLEPSNPSVEETPLAPELAKTQGSADGANQKLPLTQNAPTQTTPPESQPNTKPTGAPLSSVESRDNEKILAMAKTVMAMAGEAARAEQQLDITEAAASQSVEAKDNAKILAMARDVMSMAGEAVKAERELLAAGQPIDPQVPKVEEKTLAVMDSRSGAQEGGGTDTVRLLSGYKIGSPSSENIVIATEAAKKDETRDNAKILAMAKEVLELARDNMRNSFELEESNTLPDAEARDNTMLAAENPAPPMAESNPPVRITSVADSDPVQANEAYERTESLGRASLDNYSPPLGYDDRRGVGHEMVDRRTQIRSPSDGFTESYEDWLAGVRNQNGYGW
eukprot:CAMPEP_0168725900 /NCGR_PEP_ID=MMETSP0724-20121128/4393_1 /TAXON_ID=265536 /ORGANISM="Amphiprora sp., Strain CCMP467" /LENGTH=1153 /DNA_ID=CAMNT_0008772701 /DNA_START=39 /DNA_END=3500 /DNA_ORIENTATION=+